MYRKVRDQRSKRRQKGLNKKSLRPVKQYILVTISYPQFDRSVSVLFKVWSLDWLKDFDLSVTGMLKDREIVPVINCETKHTVRSVIYLGRKIFLVKEIVPCLIF